MLAAVAHSCHPLALPLPPATADSTGTHSLYTTYQDHEIMFHVSTMLPYTPNNQQQV